MLLRSGDVPRRIAVDAGPFIAQIREDDQEAGQGARQGRHPVQEVGEPRQHAHHHGLPMPPA